MKNKTLHRHAHPIHWHGSMIVAIVAILLTSLKCSTDPPIYDGFYIFT
jgi:hypothetical protein